MNLFFVNHVFMTTFVKEMETTMTYKTYYKKSVRKAELGFIV